MARSSQAFRLVVINLAVLFALVVVAALATEVYFRLAPKSATPAGHRFQDHDRVHHVFTPDFDSSLHVHEDIPPYTFRTNELGLRIDEPYPIAKPEGTLRVLVIGDSFIEGYAYERTIPAHLERKLAPRFDNIEVIHAGISTYAPMLHYFSLKYRLLPLDPDVVVMAIDMTDAYDDAVYYAKHLYFEDGEPAGVRSDSSNLRALLQKEMAAKLEATNPDRWVAELASFSAVARRYFERNIAGYAQTYASLLPSARPFTFTLPIFDIDDPKTKAWVELSQTWIVRIHELLEARDIPLVLAMYPYEKQLREPRLLKIFDDYAALARARGFLFHSAAPAFVAYEGDPGELFLSGDTHYDYEGLAIWGDSLADFLAEHLPAVTSRAKRGRRTSN